MGTFANTRRALVNLSRKRKKELRQLQNSASKRWEDQQVILGSAAQVAREAGRQLGNFNREQVVPVVQDKYRTHIAPVVDRGAKASKRFVHNRVVPAAGAVMGTAMSAWDAASDTRARLAIGRAAKTVAAAPAKKKGVGAGGVVAIILGVAAAVGVLYAAWQTLRADDELWVADDPMASPEA